MEKKEAIVALTYIMAGALMQMLNGVQDGFSSTMVSVSGFIIFCIGLSKLKKLVDRGGQQAIGILMTGAIIGAVGAFLDLIPFMGSYASVIYFVAFTIELFGLVQFKSSRTFGRTGKNGFTVLIIAMVICVFRAIVGMLPLFNDSRVFFFFGDFMISMITVVAVVLVLTGWMKVQEDLAERFVTA